MCHFMLKTGVKSIAYLRLKFPGENEKKGPFCINLPLLNLQSGFLKGRLFQKNLSFPKIFFRIRIRTI